MLEIRWNIFPITRFRSEREVFYYSIDSSNEEWGYFNWWAQRVGVMVVFYYATL